MFITISLEHPIQIDAPDSNDYDHQIKLEI